MQVPDQADLGNAEAVGIRLFFCLQSHYDIESAETDCFNSHLEEPPRLQYTHFLGQYHTQAILWRPIFGRKVKMKRTYSELTRAAF
ncbi:unnamed protein product [Protopolystoma xenopodis]|uniref:Uncharacterized protein n=1 Tax=Protopolystoma xenopodis TaxID=117903 RepID=A0A448XLQ9_9PLAT|nr:unnamed protein product [Protopolystoma xenopodis]